MTIDLPRVRRPSVSGRLSNVIQARGGAVAGPQEVLDGTKKRASYEKAQAIQFVFLIEKKDLRVEKSDFNRLKEGSSVIKRVGIWN